MYKGQVWGEKSYLELCNQNVVNILYDPIGSLSREDKLEQKGTLYVPPVPGRGFIDDKTMIPWDSEILQSFADLTNITNMTFHSFDATEDSPEEFTYQIQVGGWLCHMTQHDRQCVPPNRYYPWYIWTKDGFKKNRIIQI